VRGLAFMYRIVHEVTTKATKKSPWVSIGRLCGDVAAEDDRHARDKETGRQEACRARGK
jgi:hypothetical protein